MSSQLLRCGGVSSAVAAILLVLGQCHVACGANPNSRDPMLPLDIHNLTNAQATLSTANTLFTSLLKDIQAIGANPARVAGKKVERTAHPNPAIAPRRRGPANARRDGGRRLQPASRCLELNRFRKSSPPSAVRRRGKPTPTRLSSSAQPQGHAGTKGDGPEAAGPAAATEIGGSLSGAERGARPADLPDDVPGYSRGRVIHDGVCLGGRSHHEPQEHRFPRTSASVPGPAHHVTTARDGRNC